MLGNSGKGCFYRQPRNFKDEGCTYLLLIKPLDSSYKLNLSQTESEGWTQRQEKVPVRGAGKDNISVFKVGGKQNFP
jgi:hypothetical protein